MVKKAIRHRRIYIFNTRPTTCLCRRRFHEPDSHMRTRRGQSLRLPHGTGSPRGRGSREPATLDAVELPASASRCRHDCGRHLLIGVASPSLRRPRHQRFFTAAGRAPSLGSMAASDRKTAYHGGVVGRRVLPPRHVSRQGFHVWNRKLRQRTSTSHGSAGSVP